MRFVIFALICSSISGLCQRSSIDQNILRVKAIVEGYEICNSTVFCFECLFHIDKDKKEIEIRTLRYNYEGSPSRRVLTETRICKIPIEKVRTVMLYPGAENSFIIAGEIQQQVNGKKETVDMIFLDFNNDFVAKKLKESFLREFNELIKYYKK